ncbi:hypothetical protein F5148DRAFT_330426 [Russula earlei]|uniref:Uncharacterized protein n=1 Tax=Russula earlei TaxID=71964 RepID=A0ACC0U3C2_9AGAM|nr:hypothetical protein F5148DRAFT_330426 [Russula earlei]
MSSDADELGGYDPSTPHQPSKRRKTVASHPAQAAGPSTATAKAQKGMTTRQRKPSRDTPVVVTEDDEDIPEVVQPDPKSKGKSKASASPATNGKPPSKTKGRRKAASASNGHKSGVDLVVIEEDDDDEPLQVAKPPPPTKKGKTRVGAPIPVEEAEIVGEAEDTPSREVERLKEERNLYKIKSEELSETLLQLIRTRNTEPEEQLATMKAHYDAAAKGRKRSSSRS